MMTAHRKAMLRTMVMNLLKYQRIEMTLARAKEVRRLAEHVITLAKKNTVDSRRRVYAVIADRDLVKKLFTEIVPLFKSRTSGFTRIIHTGFRRGDGADMAILELTERKTVEKTASKKAKRDKAAKAGDAALKHSPKQAEGADSGETGGKSKAAPKAKTHDDEKRAEKAKSEDKKAADNRGLMKNIRGLFRKRGDF